MYKNTVMCCTGRYHVSTLSTSLIKLASDVSFKSVRVEFYYIIKRHECFKALSGEVKLIISYMSKMYSFRGCNYVCCNNFNGSPSHTLQPP